MDGKKKVQEKYKKKKDTIFVFGIFMHGGEASQKHTSILLRFPFISIDLFAL